MVAVDKPLKTRPSEIIVIFAPGSYTFAMSAHREFRRFSASSSALSGYMPKTLWTLLADLKANEGRIMDSCFLAPTNLTRLSMNSFGHTPVSVNLCKAYSDRMVIIVADRSISSFWTICTSRAWNGP